MSSPSGSQQQRRGRLRPVRPRRASSQSQEVDPHSDRSMLPFTSSPPRPSNESDEDDDALSRDEDDDSASMVSGASRSSSPGRGRRRGGSDAGSGRRRPRRDEPVGAPEDDDEEAEEAAEHVAMDVSEEASLLSEERDGEDLFGPDADNDYRAMPKLDRYSSSGIDDESDGTPMRIEDRLAAEAELNRRDRERRKYQARLPAAFLQAAEEDEEDDEARFGRPPPRRRRRVDAAGRRADVAELLEGDDAMVDLGTDSVPDTKGMSLREFVALEETRRNLARRFRNFLTTFMDATGDALYGTRISEMARVNAESLHVSYEHLYKHDAYSAFCVVNMPSEVLKIFDEVAYMVVLDMFPDYKRVHTEIHVRITDLPASDSLRDLRQSHQDRLIRVSGVVTRRSGVFPQLKYVKYDCGKCGFVMGPFYQDTSSEIRVGSCPECQSKGPFNVNAEQTVYRNYQRLTLQESPGTVPPGRLPRQKEVICLWDLIDKARPGEEIEVTGVYRNQFDISLNNQHGFPVFATVIEANYISKKEDLYASFNLTEDDIHQIRELARDDHIGQKIIRSIAPSIYGHENIKTAIALSLFGGEPKDVQGKHRLRGDINVLLLGDPGTAKSQFLKYVEKTAHRAVFATGQGASAVGLTASVHKDPVTREWTLEGGALVLADKGVCLIDEFDKMNDADRTSIHEAMEQQSISISKAGIVTSLQARCAIIAAANPVKGRYDATQPFSQNVDLTEPILSRFDVLCVVRDLVDPVEDEKLALFVVGSHIRSHPDGDDPTASRGVATEAVDADQSNLISQELLRKYIMYAKRTVHPKLQEIDQDKIARLYGELRRESLASGSIPITVRHIESIIRMSEAHARMHLREVVRSDDVDLAIRVCLDSFINAQKYSVMKQMRKTFSKYITYKRDNDELLLFLLQGLARDELMFQQLRNDREPPTVIHIPVVDFEARAKEYSIHDVKPFYKSRLFTSNRFTLDEARRVISLPV